MKESFCCCLLFDNVVHPHSLNKFSNGIDLVKPVTRRAASFLIFCKVCSEHSSHTTEAYSTAGKRKDIYIWLRAFLLIEYFSLRIIPRTLVAGRTMFPICECHCPVLLKVTPRCLWLSTKLTGILSKKSCRKILIFLRVNKTPLVFSGLNVTSHCLAQFDKSCISWLIIPAMSSMCAAEKEREISSANSLVQLRRCSAISFMYTRNKRGPRTDPCGTPSRIDF